MSAPPVMRLTRAEWFARREARREKQRADSIRRAEAMHETRLEFERENESATIDPPSGIRIGCSGWFYWHWRDCFYSRDTPTREWFDFYASQFRTVELNAPFYSWPTIATVNRWRQQIGRRRFIYTIKVCELITHTKRFVGTRTLVRDFGHIADLLGPAMGPFLFQLPPSVKYTKSMLTRVLEQLDPRRLNVVEFRHKSWWNANVFDAFCAANATFCSCSGPRLPDELVKTSDDVYLRFHGTKRWYRHDYTTEELTAWAERIRDCRARRVWVYFNNDREGYAIKNARELIRLLKR